LSLPTFKEEMYDVLLLPLTQYNVNIRHLKISMHNICTDRMHCTSYCYLFCTFLTTHELRCLIRIKVPYSCDCHFSSPFL